MTVFSCSVCGSHAFKLSANFTGAHCDQCKMHLGTWQALRIKIVKSLSSPSQEPPAAHEAILPAFSAAPGAEPILVNSVQQVNTRLPSVAKPIDELDTEPGDGSPPA